MGRRRAVSRSIRLRASECKARGGKSHNTCHSSPGNACVWTLSKQKHNSITISPWQNKQQMWEKSSRMRRRIYGVSLLAIYGVSLLADSLVSVDRLLFSQNIASLNWWDYLHNYVTDKQLIFQSVSQSVVSGVSDQWVCTESVVNWTGPRGRFWKCDSGYMHHTF